MLRVMGNRERVLMRRWIFPVQNNYSKAQFRKRRRAFPGSRLLDSETRLGEGKNCQILGGEITFLYVLCL
jgi:hypothetical protein